MDASASTSVAYRGADGNRISGVAWQTGGRPVLLLHGGGQTRHAWTAIGERMAASGLAPIALDQRGHGTSDWVESRTYSFFDFGRDAAALAAAIEAETGQTPLLVGASLGGIAGLLAMDGTSAFAGLVLVDITPRQNPQGIERIRRFMADRMDVGFASLEEAGEAVAGYQPDRPRPTSLDGLKRNLRLGPDGRYRWHWDPAFISGPKSAGSSRTKAAERMAASAAHLSVPTLLVRGAQSDIVTQEEVDAFLALAPSAEFVDIAGAGHMVAGDRNDVFGAAILDFLARHGFCAPG